MGVMCIIMSFVLIAGSAVPVCAGRMRLLKPLIIRRKAAHSFRIDHLSGTRCRQYDRCLRPSLTFVFRKQIAVYLMKGNGVQAARA